MLWLKSLNFVSFKHITALCFCSAGVLWGNLAFAQTSSANSDYESLLQQISNMQLILLQKTAYLDNQSSEINNLRNQIRRVRQTKTSIPPMIYKMVAAIDNEISQDLPFRTDERLSRLTALHELVNNETIGLGQKIRRAFKIYDIEVSYGQTVEAYEGDYPEDGPQPELNGSRRNVCLGNSAAKACALNKEDLKKIKEGIPIDDFADDIYDGHYIRFGRLALVFRMADGTHTLRYDPENKQWVKMKGRAALNMAYAVRMSQGLSSPAILTIPVQQYAQ